MTREEIPAENRRWPPRRTGVPNKPSPSQIMADMKIDVLFDERLISHFVDSSIDYFNTWYMILLIVKKYVLRFLRQYLKKSEAGRIYIAISGIKIRHSISMSEAAIHRAIRSQYAYLSITYLWESSILVRILQEEVRFHSSDDEIIINLRFHKKSFEKSFQQIDIIPTPGVTD